MAGNNLYFLEGGGEMGALARAVDWGNTSIGRPETWPVSLRTTVNLLLKSKFPMILLWGKDHITIYNDAYRPSLGINGRHPGAFGKNAKESFPEIWPHVEPIAEQVMSGGESTWIENQPYPMYRNGRIEEVYWTFCYGPVTDDEGKVAGILVTCTETTDSVLKLQKVSDDLKSNTEAERYVRKMTDSMPAVLWLTEPDGSCIYLNQRWYDITGQNREEALGFGWISATHPEDQATVGSEFERANANETSFSARYRLRQKDGSYRWTIDKGTARFDENGKYAGMIGTVVDIHDQVEAEAQQQQAVLESESKFRSLFEELLSYFEQSPVGVAILKEDKLTFTMANPFYGELVGRKPEDIIGKPLLEALPEIRGQGFDILLRDVISTGKPYLARAVAVDILREGKIVTIYVDLAYQPRQEHDGRVTGVLVVATDVTDQVVFRKKIEESEARFRSLINEAPVGTCLYVGPEFRVEVANDIILKYWGKGRNVLGKPMLEIMPELIGQPFPGIIRNVYNSGKTYEEKAARADLVVDGKLSTFYFDFTYKPLFNENHEVYAILDMAVDVTAQVVARKELEESETKLRGIILSAPAGIGLFVGRDLIVENPNQTFIDIVGKGPDIVGKPLREVMPELLTEGQPFLQILDDVFTTGVMFQSPGSLVKIVQHGVMTYNYYNITYSPVFNADGEVYAILDIAIDVTDQIKAQKRAEEAEAAFRDAIELAELGTWSLDFSSGIATFSRRLHDWFSLDDTKEYHTVVPGIHEHDSERVESEIEKALNSSTSEGLDTEYIAINRQTGQHRIIHIQGKPIFDVQGNVVKLNGTSQDITVQRQHQMALEQEVQLRTEQLAAAVEELQTTNEELEESNDSLVYSNDELAQYAYVASHDLQEPLRKIRVFTSRLSNQNISPAESATVIAKISAAAERMTLLIQDLLDFSRLLKSNDRMQPVSLNEVVAAVINDFELTIQEKNAIIDITDLPVIQAVGLQINQLFYNLVSNALKFVKPGESPHVKISSGLISHEAAANYLKKTIAHANYYDIIVSDNGIGFETEFSEQIFEVFKRLHGRENYPGSGIGLALCRRIANNHNGFLYAESEPGKGTTFHLLLPDRQV